MPRMNGVSPKILPPLQIALGAVIADWATDGHVGRESLATLALAVVATAFAYLAPIGDVTVDDDVVEPTLAVATPFD